ncbi:UNVERIFIED_ORG: L-amino acid N-acyltransferase YncA [Bacillus proteolyticus]|uniref:GCN5-related N-acetyltransferase n=1 Tax=Bacillus thuringiensis TaxID=1428 RepID=A0A1C4G1Q2_BACTU|nr:GCN5-related N-acetyltransferase [Bacillus thuringiensis]
MLIRNARTQDIEQITAIYNQGIQDRIATLEENEKTTADMEEWFVNRGERYAVLVAEMEGQIVGWVFLNPYSHRCAYNGVADLSIYIDREQRGKGIGKRLLQKIEEVAIQNDFYKIVLFTFPFNVLGQGLYRSMGYREVGVFKNQGKLDGKFVDVMVMEKNVDL